MERLYHCINNLFRNTTLKLIYFDKKDPTFSHFFFADDLVILRKTTDDQVWVIKKALDDFYANSSHKVSVNNVLIFFSCKINTCEASCINKNFEFQAFNNLRKYLRDLLLYDKVNKETYHYIIEKIN